MCNGHSNKEKICIALLKYVPVLSAFLMLLHVATLLLGVTLFISEIIVLTIVTIMVIFWSYCFKFCLVHRLTSIYTIIVLWCCYYHRFFGFGEYLEPIRLIMLYIGVVIFICLGIKYANRYKKFITKDN